MNQNRFLIYCLFSVLLSFQNLSVQANDTLEDLIQSACNTGDLKNLLIKSQKFINSNLTSIESASILHTLSNLALILNADTNKAVVYYSISITSHSIIKYLFFRCVCIFFLNLGIPQTSESS